jgi:hypothetical protein
MSMGRMTIKSDYTEAFSTPPVGPQLTEHTGNRIATALERIADAIVRQTTEAVSGPAFDWATVDRILKEYRREHAAYPLGDPAPLRNPAAGANGPIGPAS